MAQVMYEELRKVNKGNGWIYHRIALDVGILITKLHSWH
jgi:hypothetical protein